MEFSTPFDSVTGGMLVRGLPRSPEYIPRINCRPVMDEHLRDIAGGLQDVIQRLANDNVLRQALFYLMSDRGFDNDDFDAMCSQTTDYADMLMHDDNYRPRDAIAKAVDEMCVVWAAIVTDENPKLDRYLTKTQVEVLNDAISLHKRLARTIDDFMADVQVRDREYDDDRGRSGRRESRGATASSGSYRDRGGRDDRDDRGSRGRGRDEGRGRDRDRGPAPGGRRTNISDIPPTTSRDRRPPAPEPLSNGRTFSTGRNSDTAVPAPVPVNTARAPAPVQPVNKSSRPAKVQQLKAYGPHFDFLAPGVYPILFNYINDVAFYDLDKYGDYQQTVVAKEGCKVKFEDHDTERFLIARTASVRNAIPDTGLADRVLTDVTRAKTIESMLEKLEAVEIPIDLVDVLEHETIQISTPLQCAEGEEDYYSVALSYLSNRGLPTLDVENSVICFTAFTPTRWFMTDPTAVAVALSLSKAGTWTELRHRFLALREHIALIHWEHMHSAVTQHINEFVKISLNEVIDITSFVDDLDALRDALLEVSPAVLRTFDDAGLDAVRATTLYADNQDKVALIFDAPPTHEHYARFMTVQDIVLLPVLSTDLALAGVGHVLAVTPHAMPLLHEAITHRYKKLTYPARYMKFITHDAMTLYIHASHREKVFVVTDRVVF